MQNTDDPAASVPDDAVPSSAELSERRLPDAIGPILFARGADGARVRLSALLLLREAREPPAMEVPDSTVSARRLHDLFGWTAWGYDFALPVAAGGASYAIGERRYDVVTDLTGDLRLAFVSCNGQEEGDDDRSLDERNLMWRRLLTEHEARPFALLFQGGDQIYADEATSAHPDMKRWKTAAVDRKPEIAFTPAMREAVRRWFAMRYLQLASEPAMAALVSRVPSMMIWDDHDIMDGWGSHPPEVLDSPAGRGLFAAAREMYALFQLGVSPAEASPLMLDASGRSTTIAAAFPGFRVVAPDLRSERRLDRVMGENGWRTFDAALAAVEPAERVFVVSSVPAIGPRLSIVERVSSALPFRHDYADDLRDQWQSYAHREEWQRFLAAMATVMTERDARVTVLSGEIHLATRGTMQVAKDRDLHQLVASGISHPEPSAIYAGALGTLARFGDAPLPGKPMRLHRLPGQKAIYAAERNYLVLERAGDAWTAAWELEHSGRTAPLPV